MKNLFIVLLILLCSTVLDAKVTGNPITVSQKTTICQGDSILLGGEYRKNAGTYYDSLKTTNGCDSIIVTTLKFNSSFYIKVDVLVCKFDSILINGKYEKGYGIFIDSFKTVLGCDSLIEKRVYKSFKPTITKFGPFGLQSNVSGDRYRWLDCNDNFAVVNGQTFQTALNLKSGSYAVEVTKDGCIDTSECSSINVGLNELEFISNLLVYPNPATDNITIGLNEEYSSLVIDIFSVTGKLIKTEAFSNSKELTINTQKLPAGVYMLQIDADGKRATKQLIIQ